jgi:hypothetical protein
MSERSTHSRLVRRLPAESRNYVSHLARTDAQLFSSSCGIDLAVMRPMMKRASRTGAIDTRRAP